MAFLEEIRTLAKQIILDCNKRCVICDTLLEYKVRHLSTVPPCFSVSLARLPLIVSVRCGCRG